MPGLRDSKKLSAARREALFEKLNGPDDGGDLFWWSEGSETAAQIDGKGVSQAWNHAVGEALYHVGHRVERLGLKVEKIIVDGVRRPDPSHTSALYFSLRGVPLETCIGAEDKYQCVAGASVIAKVIHDRKMLTLEGMSSHEGRYGFRENKGYPTKAHLAALDKYGPGFYHRETFAPVRRALEKRNGKVALP
jgi:ribonuclease HII